MKRIVVADTSPTLYLHLIGEIELIPALFREIHIPAEIAGGFARMFAIRQMIIAPSADS
ncbi:MAG: hypothetical protein WAN35_15540 [Terracidiphilus sp.]